MLLRALLVVVLGACRVQARAVFASFILSNAGSFDVARWTANIQLAQAAHIDAFALSIAYGWPDNDKQLGLAFSAATATGFKLFFSFDYRGNSTWPPDSVSSVLETYANNSAYYQWVYLVRHGEYGNIPLVSATEGADHAADWKTIANDGLTYFFVPDYSSIGPEAALKAGGGYGVANGLASRAPAWPDGTSNITAAVDASYVEAMQGGRPYMMPVSPWFFSDTPVDGPDDGGVRLRKSGDLWHQRWQVIVSLDDFTPDLVQVFSWNDFAESHYIGPVDETIDADMMPHDGWREHLPHYIDLYKTGCGNFTRESIVTWFRPSLGAACGSGGTQDGIDPLLLMPDRLYFSALLTSRANLTVTYGGQNYSITAWDAIPDGAVGVYHTSLAIATASGPWAVRAVRDGAVVIDYAVPQGVSGSCTDSWNAWVGSARSNTTLTDLVRTPHNLTRIPCVDGWGPDPYAAVCDTTCMYGYCPSFACVCTKRSFDWNWPPGSANAVGRSVQHPGDKRYDDLCQVSCDMGTCPGEVCSSRESRFNASQAKSAGASSPRPPGVGLYRAAGMVWMNLRHVLGGWPL